MKLEVEAAKEEGGAAAERAQAEADARLAAQKAEVDAGRREPAQKAPPMHNAQSSIPPVKYKFTLSELPRALHRIAETRANGPPPGLSEHTAPSARPVTCFAACKRQVPRPRAEHRRQARKGGAISHRSRPISRHLDPRLPS